MRVGGAHPPPFTGVHSSKERRYTVLPLFLLYPYICTLCGALWLQVHCRLEERQACINGFIITKSNWRNPDDTIVRTLSYIYITHNEVIKSGVIGNLGLCSIVHCYNWEVLLVIVITNDLSEQIKIKNSWRTAGFESPMQCIQMTKPTKNFNEFI